MSVQPENYILYLSKEISTLQLAKILFEPVSHCGANRGPSLTQTKMAMHFESPTASWLFSYKTLYQMKSTKKSGIAINTNQRAISM